MFKIIRSIKFIDLTFSGALLQSFTQQHVALWVLITPKAKDESTDHLFLSAIFQEGKL